MKRITLLSTLLFLTVVAFASAKILFVDDFEDSDIGKETSKWEHLQFNPGNAKITVEKDPTDAKNRAAKTIGIGLYLPKAAGRAYRWS